MRLLLDTHALLWWLLDDPRLSRPARRAIEDVGNAIFVSAASAWEVALKAAKASCHCRPTPNGVSRPRWRQRASSSFR
jgi:PIN domain nuclease of toxin-antitoxin system